MKTHPPTPSKALHTAALWRLVGAAACLFASLIANAAVSFEQLQEKIRTDGVAAWQKERQKQLSYRDRLLTETVAQAWKNLDAQTDLARGKAPLARFNTLPVDDSFSPLALWLKWKILFENADGRFSIAYAVSLDRLSTEKANFIREAAIYYWHARMSLLIDGGRCVDQSSVEAWLNETFFTPQVAALSKRLMEMSPRETAVAMLEAVGLETSREERAPAAWLCNRGMHSTMRALASGQKPTLGKPEENQLGRPATLDTSGIPPAFRTDEAWRKQRQSIIDEYVRAAAKKLEE